MRSTALLLRDCAHGGRLFTAEVDLDIFEAMYWMRRAQRTGDSFALEHWAHRIDALLERRHTFATARRG